VYAFEQALLSIVVKRRIKLQIAARAACCQLPWHGMAQRVLGGFEPPKPALGDHASETLPRHARAFRPRFRCFLM